MYTIKTLIIFVALINIAQNQNVSIDKQWEDFKVSGPFLGGLIYIFF